MPANLACYDARMYDIGHSLQDAFDSAHSQLARAQAAVARANAGGSESRKADAAMAQTARSAIFTEALLASSVRDLKRSNRYTASIWLVRCL